MKHWSLPAPAVMLVMSSRCCGLSPSGPPAEPLGNEWSALASSLSLTTSLTTKAAFRASSSGGGGRVVSGWAVGCFNFRAAMVAVRASATESSEQVRLTALLSPPLPCLLKS